MVTNSSEFLNGIWGSSPTNVFVVGQVGSIIRFDGSVWYALNSGFASPLAGVSGAFRDDVLTCGYIGAILRYRP
jgi:hypothetical protein